jgi:hypothetical protein
VRSSPAARWVTEGNGFLGSAAVPGPAAKQEDREAIATRMRSPGSSRRSLAGRVAAPHLAASVTSAAMGTSWGARGRRSTTCLVGEADRRKPAPGEEAVEVSATVAQPVARLVEGQTEDQDGVDHFVDAPGL